MLTAERDATVLADRPRIPAPRLDIATVCLSGTLEDKLAAAAAAGFHGVEIFENDLIMSPWSPREVRKQCAELGLEIDLYQPFRDFEAVPPDVLAANLRRAERKLAVLEQLGADTLLVCSSVSPDAIDDDDLAAEQLHMLAVRAAERGLRIAYEALAWGRFVNTYEHSWQIVRRADHPALGLCLDSFHVLSRGDDPAGIRDIPGSKIFFLQLADAPPLHMDVLEWSRHHRMFPSQGSFDLTGFASAVLATGYEGPLSLEVFNDVFRQADPRRAAVDAMRSLLVLEETLGTSGPPALRERIRAVAPPAAPPLGGHVFTELAVDGVCGPAVEATLAAMGFAHTGQHRSKPVQLWQQGSARILLNSTPRPTAAPGTVAICALAVESPDPAASARRAERLLAPVLPRARQPSEADLCSVAAPNGTAIFFCRSDNSDGGRDGSWLADFTPTGTPPGQHGLLSATDHISLTEPFDDFDRAALFYRSVLGLRPAPTTEFAAPFGLIRSRAATDPAHQVRITLNSALLRRGDWAPAVTEPQHIAFTTDDAIASAKAMRARGAPLLSIPDNYYDDLDARLAPPPRLFAAMCEHSVLYDRDEHGEFLHFYTEILGSRVFFEVVQRIGAYTGYGAVTTPPVRMAAHRRRRLRTQQPLAATDDPPAHDFSVAHLSALSLSPPQLVHAAASAGYRYVGLRLNRVTPDEPHFPLATDPVLLRETKACLAGTGVAVLDVELARVGPRDNPRDFLRILEVGAELGARHVITQLPDPDRGRKTAHFAELCDLAAPLGLTVDLEFPSWTETPNLTEATYVLRAADRPNAGILIDLLHFARSDSSIEELSRLPRSWFHFAHVCDAPAEIPSTQDGLIHTARFERLFPGEGGIDVRGILAALPPDIPYALEIPRAGLAAQVGEGECVRLALQATRRFLTPSRLGSHATAPARVWPAGVAATVVSEPA
jgi:sugar phosphate isomerase/epimerase/4-hydroxyphenylpyruvate dioxygenase-like putative hemolysin